MRHEFASEAREMSLFHVERHQGKLTDRSTERLAVGQAALVIGGLSLLSWMIVIGVIVACRAIM
jgi:hypothetical protein